MLRGSDPSSWLDEIDLKVPLPKLLPNRKIAHPKMTKAFLQKAHLKGKDDASHEFSQTVCSHETVTRFCDAFTKSPMSRDLLRYILSVGSPKVRLDLAPQDLTYEVIASLGILFSALDLDSDGAVSAHEMTLAAPVVGVRDYHPSFFRRLDDDCRGNITFSKLLHFLFPQYTMSELMAKQRTLHDKPLTIILPTREMLSAEDLHEVDMFYNFLCRIELPTDTPNDAERCTLPKYLSLLVGKDTTMRQHTIDMFCKHDVNNSNALSRDEFLEMHKHCYPPFRRVTRRVPEKDLDGADPLNSGKHHQGFRPKNDGPSISVTANDLKITPTEYTRLRSNFASLQKSCVVQHLTDNLSSPRNAQGSRMLVNIAATKDERKQILENSNYNIVAEQNRTRSKSIC